MAQIFNFPTKTPAAHTAPGGPRVERDPANRPDVLVNTEALKITPDAAVDDMVLASAAMTVLATMSFYAKQGWDGGKKARHAMGAVQELLASKGIVFVMESSEEPTSA